MDRRSFVGVSVGVVVGVAGCLDTFGVGASDGDLDRAEEYASTYGSLKKRIEDAAEDYERGHDDLDNEDYSEAEARFANALEEFEELIDDWTDFETELEDEYGAESTVVESFESFRSTIRAYKFAADSAHRGAERLVDGDESGWMLVGAAIDSKGEDETVDLPSEDDFLESIE